jgi:hypothetical protein
VPVTCPFFVIEKMSFVCKGFRRLKTGGGALEKNFSVFLFSIFRGWHVLA